MKLRNKKTGEIWDIGKIITNDFPSYETLSQINADFEDYKPTEPLIKDKKIRKLVKNFALYTNATWIQYEITVQRGEFWTEGGVIANKDWKNLDGLVSNQCYTIAELCGEEEE